jgi:hypothetical protein
MVEVLSKRIFVLMLISEWHGGVCRDEYFIPCCYIADACFVKIMHLSESCQSIFVSLSVTPLKTEFLPNGIRQFNSNITGNILHHHYKYAVNAF